MATRIIDMALPTIPLIGTELIEMSEGGTKSVKVAVNEALDRLYADTTAIVIATPTGLRSEIDTLIFQDKNGNDALIIENGGVGMLRDNVLRLVTDETGVTVFGTLTANDLKVDGDSIILGSTYLTEISGGGLKIAGDLEVTGTLDLPEGSVEASDINYNEVIGATYSTVQEAMDQLGSSGLIEGGIITSDGTAAINVSAGSGMLRTSDDIHAPLMFVDFPETLGLSIPADASKDIVVNYNGGTPIVEAVDVGTFNPNTYFLLGQVGRADTELFISNLRQRISGFAVRSLARMYGTDAVVRNGNTGLILGESADTNRYVTMTSGEVWSLLDLEAIDGFNSGIDDDFTTIYRDSPSGYVETPGETQWDMVKYDDGSGTLQDLSKDRYGVRWFWLIPSSDDLAMVYGTGNWKSLAEAEAEPVPTEVPSIITEFGVLIGKIIAKKDVPIAAEVSSAFEQTYNFAAVTDHGNLSNLAAPWDDHTQYSHIDGRRDFTSTVGGIDPILPSDFVTLEYMTKLGTETQRLFYNVDQTGHLDIHVEHIRDVEFVDFNDNIPVPDWQEGRVFWDKENHTFGVYNDIEEMTLQVGQESYLRVRNISGAMIPDGSPVYISGADEGLPTIEPAKSDDISTLNAVTIATHNIDDTSNGYTTITGAVNDINTSNFNSGDSLYVSDSTAGVITNVRPKSPSIAHRVGVATDIGVSGRMVSDSHPSSDQMQTMVFTLPLKGVVDDIVPLTGTFREIGNGLTGDVVTPFAVSNQHIYLQITSLTGSGDVTITGSTIQEATAIVEDSTAIETITVSESGVYYQSNSKWWDAISIEIPPGITAITYNYGVIGYPDMGNRNFSIIGYRCDAYSEKDAADFSLIINRLKDDGNKKMSVEQLENIGVDSQGAGIVDNLRTGMYDRTYVPNVGTIWGLDTVLTFKQLDFNSYFTANENDILAKTGHEGMFISIQGEPGGGISDVDYIVFYLYYELTP